MSNAEVVLRVTEVFQEDKGELWEAWDEKPKWISKKELDEQDMQGFWENWDEKPKTLSAKECFKETWLDEEDDESSDEECSSDEETESSDDNTESLLMRAEKYELSGGKVESLPSAKEFFKEDECWWRDAVEEVEEPKKVIKPIELFKDEEKPWWLKNESDTSSSSSDEESEQIPKQTLQTKDAVPAKEFFKEEECWWEEKPKVISSKEMFKDELPWWQTEDENEFSLNKAVPAKDIFKEDTNWWEDNAAEDDEAYESIISNSSTMYSASEGTSDIFQETDYFSTSDKPAVVAKEFFKEDVWWDDDCNDDKTDTIEDDSDDETQAESIVEEEIIETDSTESILTEDIVVEPSEDASNCERNDQNLNFEADDENSEAVESLNDDEISSIEESVSEKKLEFIQSDNKENSVEISSSNESTTNSDKSNKLNSLKNLRVSNSSPVVINRMDECLAELDARIAVADSQLKKIDSSSTTSFDSSSIDLNSIRDDKNTITTDKKPEKVCNMRDKFDVIKVSVRVSDKDDIKSTASDNNSPNESKNQNESVSINNTQKNDELFDHLVNILTKDNNSDCASIGEETIEHNVNQEQYCSDSSTSESPSPIEINDSKPIPSPDDETMLSPYLSREVSIESDIATPNQLSKGIWRCSTYDNISISQFDKMASMLGQQEISGTDIDKTNPTLDKCTVHSDSESTVLSTYSTSSPPIQRFLSDSIEPTTKTSKRDTSQKISISRSSAPDQQSSTVTDAKKPMNSPKQI